MKLTKAQTGQALDPLLKQMSQTTHSFVLKLLAQALKALAANLTEAQASLAVDPVLKQIGQTTDPCALWALAGALQALPGKLTEAQARQFSMAAAASLAWAAEDEEAVDSARALVTLSGSMANRVELLAKSIVYPTAADRRPKSCSTGSAWERKPPWSG
jgi:hypothetical protein